MQKLSSSSRSKRQRAKRAWTIGILSAVCLSQAFAVEHAHAHQQPLRLEIVLMRHGVRAPTATNAALSTYSNQAWPNWPVDAGFLTPHGEDVMTALGQRYRKEYLKRGLLQDGCNADRVVTVSDSTPRNQLSTQAFLSGFQPNCIAPFRVAKNAAVNPLFHFPDAATDKASKIDVVPPDAALQLG